MFNSLGGADGRYTYINGYDYRPYNESTGVQFQLQGMHTTLVHHYNDTLDMLIIKPPGSSGDKTLVQVYLN